MVAIENEIYNNALLFITVYAIFSTYLGYRIFVRLSGYVYNYLVMREIRSIWQENSGIAVSFMSQFFTFIGKVEKDFVMNRYYSGAMNFLKNFTESFYKYSVLQKKCDTISDIVDSIGETIENTVNSPKNCANNENYFKCPFATTAECCERVPYSGCPVTCFDTSKNPEFDTYFTPACDKSAPQEWLNSVLNGIGSNQSRKRECPVENQVHETSPAPKKRNVESTENKTETNSPLENILSNSSIIGILQNPAFKEVCMNKAFENPTIKQSINNPDMMAAFEKLMRLTTAKTTKDSNQVTPPAAGPQCHPSVMQPVVETPVAMAQSNDSLDDLEDWKRDEIETI